MKGKNRMREYTERIRFWVTPEQRKMIEERMRKNGFTNLSAYCRLMTINGLYIKVDTSELKEVTGLVRNIANNINQYAKHANSTGIATREELQEIKNKQEEIWGLLRGIYESYSCIMDLNLKNVYPSLI